MDKLNDDEWQYLFNYLSITTMRSIIRVCRHLNQYRTKIPEMERNFQEIVNRTGFMANRVFGGFYDNLLKYTVELVYDGCEIPDRYIILENIVLFGWSGIIKAIVARNDLVLLKKISNVNVYHVYPRDVVLYAARLGLVDILEWALSIYPCPDDILANAIKSRDHETIEYVVDCSCQQIHRNIRYAIRKGYIDIAKVLEQKLYDNDLLKLNRKDIAINKDKIPSFWATIGNVDRWNLIQHVHKTNSPLLLGIDVEAIILGDFDLLMFAHHNGYTRGLDKWLARTDIFPWRNINVLKWLLDEYPAVPIRIISECVVCGGDLACLEFLHAKKLLILTCDSFKIAASNCDIATMEFLYESKCPIYYLSIKNFVRSFFDRRHNLSDTEFWRIITKLEGWGCTWAYVDVLAAEYGKLDILEHIHSRGYELSANIINGAVAMGYLNIVIWCLKNGYKWDKTTYCRCISRNDLNMLKWLCNYNNYRATCSLVSDETEICPIDNNICNVAYTYESLTIMKFAVENGYDYSACVGQDCCRYIDEYIDTLPPYITGE